MNDDEPDEDSRQPLPWWVVVLFGSFAVHMMYIGALLALRGHDVTAFAQMYVSYITLVVALAKAS